MPCAVPPITWPSTIIGLTSVPPSSHDHVVEDADVAELGIDRNHDGMRGVAERAAVALRLVAGGDLQPARVDVVRQVLRAQIPGARDLRDRRRCPPARSTSPLPTRTVSTGACNRCAPIAAMRSASSRQAVPPRRPPSPCSASPRCRWNTASTRCRHARPGSRRAGCRALHARPAPAWSPAPGRGSGCRRAIPARRPGSCARPPARSRAPSECPSRHRPRCRAPPARRRSRSRRRCGARRSRPPGAAARPAMSIAATARRRHSG